VAVVAGVWVTLLLLLASPLWLWELNESWPVQPVAALVRGQPLAPGEEVRIWHGPERPSLSWYLQRPVRPAQGRQDLPASGSGVALLAEQPPSPRGWRCGTIGEAAGLELLRCRRDGEAR
jgi:hypothetical protein